jgi:hypothetical protein
MEEEIVDYLKNGYRILCRTEKWAQLWRPKVFSYVWFFVMFILLLGFGGLIYGAYYLSKREQAVYLRLEPDGSVYGFEYLSYPEGESWFGPSRGNCLTKNTLPCFVSS